MRHCTGDWIKFFLYVSIFHVTCYCVFGDGVDWLWLRDLLVLICEVSTYVDNLSKVLIM